MQTIERKQRTAHFVGVLATKVAQSFAVVGGVIADFAQIHRGDLVKGRVHGSDAWKSVQRRLRRLNQSLKSCTILHCLIGKVKTETQVNRFDRNNRTRGKLVACKLHANKSVGPIGVFLGVLTPLTRSKVGGVLLMPFLAEVGEKRTIFLDGKFKF